jgi:sentrin-specific protease 8
MKITFNEYKGFLVDEGIADNYLNITDYLPQLSSTNSNSNSKTKRNKSNLEYITNGFDCLSIAWDNTPFLLDTPCNKILKYGEYLRSLNHEFLQISNNDNDLSSHTTLYGQEVIPEMAEIEDLNNIDNGKCSRNQKKTKLSPDQRKELRKQVREAKRNTKLLKKQKKNNSNIDFGLSLTSTANSLSKISILKKIFSDCIQIAQSKSKSDVKLTDNSRLLQFDDISIDINDLKNLLDDEWLSDSNIGFVYLFLYNAYILPLLSTKLKTSKFIQYLEEKEIFISPICLLLPTFTFLIANHPDPMELLSSKVLPSNISNSQFIFCPLNDNDDFNASEGGSHWSLVVFIKLLTNDQSNNKQYIQKALIFDSMYEANASETVQLVNNMSKILYNSNDPKSNEHWDIIHVKESPQQTNGSDCGVFVSSVTSCLISQLILLSKSTNDSFIDFSLKNLRFSAIDSRIWMLKILHSLINSED